jgi:hypothetical protein
MDGCCFIDANSLLLLEMEIVMTMKAAHAAVSLKLRHAVAAVVISFKNLYNSLDKTFI